MTATSVSEDLEGVGILLGYLFDPALCSLSTLILLQYLVHSFKIDVYSHLEILQGQFIET